MLQFKKRDSNPTVNCLPTLSPGHRAPFQHADDLLNTNPWLPGICAMALNPGQPMRSYRNMMGGKKMLIPAGSGGA